MNMAKRDECIQKAKELNENLFPSECFDIVENVFNKEELKNLGRACIFDLVCTMMDNIGDYNDYLYEIQNKAGELIQRLKTHLPEETLQRTVTDIPPVKKIIPYERYFKCIQCGKEFQSKRSDAKTCSTKCRVAAARAKNKPKNETRNEAIRRALWKAYGTSNTHPTYIHNGYWEIMEALENPEQYIKNRNEEIEFIDNL